MSRRRSILWATLHLVGVCTLIGIELCARSQGASRAGLPLAPIGSLAATLVLAWNGWLLLAIPTATSPGMSTGPRAVAWLSSAALAVFAILGPLPLSTAAPWVLILAAGAAGPRSRGDRSPPIFALALGCASAAWSPALPAHASLIAWTLFGLVAINLGARQRQPAAKLLGILAPVMLAVAAIDERLPGASEVAGWPWAVAATGLSIVALWGSHVRATFLAAAFLLALSAQLSGHPSLGVLCLASSTTAILASTVGSLPRSRTVGAARRLSHPSAHLTSRGASRSLFLPWSAAFVHAGLAGAAAREGQLVVAFAALLAPPLGGLLLAGRHRQSFHSAVHSSPLSTPIKAASSDLGTAHRDLLCVLHTGLMLAALVLWSPTDTLTLLLILSWSTGLYWCSTRGFGASSSRLEGRSELDRRLLRLRSTGRWLMPPPPALPGGWSNLRRAVANLGLESFVFAASARPQLHAGWLALAFAGLLSLLTWGCLP